MNLCFLHGVNANFMILLIVAISVTLFGNTAGIPFITIIDNF